MSAIDPKASVGEMSQWQLIRLRFSRHRLATTALYVLLLMYGLAVVAEFVAPYPTGHRDIDYAYCPPQLPRWSFDHGLHVRAMRKEVDPVTFRRHYVRSDTVVKLSVFGEGLPYKFWGVLPWDRHLLVPERASEPDLLIQPISTAAADVVHGETAAPLLKPTFYLLGADKYGRDVLSRIIYGARISLSVGLIGIAFTFVLGMSIGGLSGYLGGSADNLIQRIIEIVNAFPHLPLWIALSAVLPGDWTALQVYFAITLLLSMLNWTGLARVVRGKILQLREEDYATAARLLGASHGRVLFGHLLPGFTSHILVALTLSVPGMILGETALSFLGLGLRPPVVSWGVMLQDCMDIKAVQFYPWLLAPILFIVMTVLSFNFLGDGLRDASDPYSAR